MYTLENVCVCNIWQFTASVQLYRPGRFRHQLCCGRHVPVGQAALEEPGLWATGWRLPSELTESCSWRGRPSVGWVCDAAPEAIWMPETGVGREKNSEKITLFFSSRFLVSMALRLILRKRDGQQKLKMWLSHRPLWDAGKPNSSVLGL